MTILAIELQAIAYYSKQLPIVIAILALTILALRTWLRDIRKQLSPWRNLLALSSISGVSGGFLALLVPFLLSVLHVQTHIAASEWISGVTLVVLLATSLGFALRGAARIEIVLAGLLTVTLVFTNVRF